MAGSPGRLNSASGYQAALSLDANKGSHPISVPVDSPAEIAQIFDAITYAKGCSVLRMISELLGVQTFIEGVKLHLKKHAFGNATTEELWDSLSYVSGKDVRGIMATWTQEVGYPVLDVVEDATSSSSICITQSRFLLSGYEEKNNEDKKKGTIYNVYLKTLTESGIDDEARLSTKKSTFSIPSFSFYKLNASQTGLYRVSYPLSRWKTLLTQLHLLTPTDRVGLLSDLLALVRSGHNPDLKTSHLLSFLQKFKGEKDVFVWRQILVVFEELNAAWIFEDFPTLFALSRFQAELMRPILDSFDYTLWNFKPTDGLIYQSFKTLLFSNAHLYAPVQVVSRVLFKRFISSSVSNTSSVLNPNIRRAIFSHVLINQKEEKTKENYDELVSVFQR